MKRLMLLGCVALVFAACGGGDDGGDPGNGGDNGDNGHGGATCSPSGTTVSVSAADLKFDSECLAAPAGEAFTIDFTNNDSGQSHNVAIFTDESMDEELFSGDIIPGGESTTYEVEALDAGTFHFHCDVHPQMKGTFIVE